MKIGSNSSILTLWYVTFQTFKYIKEGHLKNILIFQHYTKMVGEPAIKNVKKGDIIQIQRKGFYIVDQPYNPKSELSGVETPLLLIAIPDGHTGKEAEKPPKGAPVSAAASSGGSDALQLYNSIEQQGGIVRDLKTKDAKSQATKDAIAKLLDLKKKYKELTGSDHKPGAPPSAPAPTTPSSSESNSALNIYNLIEAQGLLVRELKGKDAKSQATKDAIAKLLELKKQYKEVSGSDHKPGVPPAASVASAPAPAPAAGSTNALDIYHQIESQGALVRELKGKDAKSQATKDAIAKLLALKKQYKEVTGSDHKPGVVPVSAPAPTPLAGGADIAGQIEAQGVLVRDLKNKDSKSQETKDAIAKLLELKKNYKEVTGSDYKPGPAPAAAPAKVTVPAPSVSGGDTLSKQIDDQALLVRELKMKDAKSQETKDAIAKLLQLKKQYKDATGSDYKPAPAQLAASAAAAPAPAPAFDEAALLKEIEEQGAVVRDAKSKDPKSVCPPFIHQ